MSDDNLKLVLAIVAVIGGITGPVATVFVAWMVHRIGSVEVKVDGMSSELVKATAGQNRAEGQLQERDANRQYQSDLPTGKEDDPVSVKPVKGKV